MLSKHQRVRGKQRLHVLILVLMEYALEELCSRHPPLQHGHSLNPCFNGICSRRLREAKEAAKSDVLILVLMEYALEDIAKDVCRKMNIQS